MGVFQAGDPGAATSPSESRCQRAPGRSRGHSQLVWNLSNGALEHARTIANHDSHRPERPRSMIARERSFRSTRSSESKSNAWNPLAGQRSLSCGLPGRGPESTLMLLIQKASRPPNLSPGTMRRANPVSEPSGAPFSPSATRTCSPPNPGLISPSASTTW